MGLVGFQVNLPQRNAELFGIFDFRSAVRCGKPMGGRKSEKILIETVRTRETFWKNMEGLKDHHHHHFTDLSPIYLLITFFQCKHFKLWSDKGNYHWRDTSIFL